MLQTVIFIFSTLIFFGCTTDSLKPIKSPELIAAAVAAPSKTLIDTQGTTIQTRFLPPPGFERMQLPANSFGSYLQNLPLKPHGTAVHYYNGDVKLNHEDKIYAAVVKMEIGNENLQQCADAVMRLRAEYLYAQQRYDDIHFNFTNGFDAQFSKWQQGYRVAVSGNKTTWVKKAPADASYPVFRKYLNQVFTYAGTASLSKELHSILLNDLKIGDVLIQGGHPGHAVIVVDMAVNPSTGEKICLLAQSYMPAQEIQILQNPNNNNTQFGAWYAVNDTSPCQTPEWNFTPKDAKRF
ncbi:MAG: DUF4846 domain-containing protein [Chitinophagales bacterium]|jgi:hypothetical protein|nr:DUF4846 domain-containing protein [Sphingobacteriales bacterium]MBP9140228.1 DUF4846 domain-containing protein [Chitinophagales bacterium]MDA0197638.1 DUF4846 domain-containing protein [Bacteroidota bacterium]MBK6889003.1 DUF4846 domain-containing protein [Sphingobacteriales bacterium]MBK8679540.1 DUF4846 domain-containing protein [Sphingobacteriales bacterium]